MTLAEEKLRSAVWNDMLRPIDVVRARATLGELEIIVDNKEGDEGLEFVGRKEPAWAEDLKVSTKIVRPAKQTQAAYQACRP